MREKILRGHNPQGMGRFDACEAPLRPEVVGAAEREGREEPEVVDMTQSSNQPCVE
jgi:hypothetical protein